MREYPYAKEPFDMKLFVLLFLKKIWLLPIAMGVGALLFGGLYYLKNVVFTGPAEYGVTSTYYIQYNNMDPVTGEMFNYTSAATWETLIISDWFVDRAWEHALHAGFEPQKYDMEKQDLKGYFTSKLPTDVRIPTSTVVTPYQEATEALNKGLQLAYIDFGIERSEIDSIQVTDETPVAEVKRNTRVGAAFVLGAVLGLFGGCFCIGLKVLWDDTVIIPESFTYRYGIPMAGYISGGKMQISDEAETNLEYLFREKKGKAALSIREVQGMESIAGILTKAGFARVEVSQKMSGKGYEELRTAEGILLLVEAGKNTAGEIRHALHQLEVQDCKVTAAFLVNADSKLICLHRFGKNKE